MTIDSRPLRLYVNPSWRFDAMHTPLLYPFWGNILTDDSLFAKELFNSYPFDTSLYTITDNVTTADMVLAPYRHTMLHLYHPARLEEYVAAARKANLPLLVDGMGDIEYPVAFERACVLRFGGFKFIKTESYRIQIPAYADDLLNRHCNGELMLREKGEKAVIGFSGWAHLSRIQTIKTLIKEIPIRLRGIIDDRYRALEKGVFWRKRAVAALQSSRGVECNFRLRKSFSGSIKTAEKDLRTVQREFIDNLLESDYALCVRGDANASVRLFEALSLGRIPIILDTECIFPFDDIVDYSTFAFVVDFRDLKHIGDLVADFHASLSNEQFQAMQKNARAVYENFFRTDAMSRQIIARLQTYLSSNPKT
jgi:hypothetical protein